MRERDTLVADDDAQLGAVLDELRRPAQERIDRDGALRVRTHSGCFVCR